MVNFTRTKQFASMAVVLALSIIISRIQNPTPVLSQANSCSAIVAQAVQSVRADCRLTARGQVCQAGTGEISPLADAQTITSKSANPSAEPWNIALLKLRAGLRAPFPQGTGDEEKMAHGRDANRRLIRGGQTGDRRTSLSAIRAGHTALPARDNQKSAGTSIVTIIVVVV